MRTLVFVLAGCSILAAQDPKPVETTAEENAVLYKIVAEVQALKSQDQLLREYLKDIARQLDGKQKEWDEEQAAILARIGKKPEEAQLQEDPKAKPRPHWMIVFAPAKKAPAASSAGQK